MDLKYRKAYQNEIATALLMLKEAAIWLNKKGIDYWQDWNNPPENFIDWIKGGFDNNEFFYVDLQNDLVGMYRLQFEDELFWGKRNDKSGYIHSFTTKRSYKGKGIGKEILQHIENNLINDGVDYLRLDCSLKIKELCKYYEINGFKLVGTISLFNDTMNLYEKELRPVFNPNFEIK